ncbi:MAG: STAS domain-containing protein [Desulfobacterales bacterium]
MAVDRGNKDPASLVTTATVGKNTVLTLKEALTAENCATFEVVVNKAIEESPNDIVLDCKSVSFLDSKALELLIRIYEELRRRGSLLKLANLNPVCKDIFSATRLVNFFHLYEDIAEAVRSKS